MVDPQSGQSEACFSLLASLLSDDRTESQPRRRLPTLGTLPGFSARLGGGRFAHGLSTALRSLGQVIFLNNPVSGLLLLLGLLLQSPGTGLLAAVGIVAATVTGRLIGADRAARRHGIHGFNGALVGAAVAAFAGLSTPSAQLAWGLVVVLAASLTTLLLEGPGRWLVGRFGLPPLTLPFCLATWLLLGLALAFPASLPLAPVSPPLAAAAAGPLAPLTLGVLRGFGQVFLCTSVATALLVLAAVLAASPLAALLGLAGGVVSTLTALALGMEPEAAVLGLGSFNGVLSAIAIGGIFHAPAPTSALIALLAAAGSALLAPSLTALLGGVGLPPLTAPFVVATLVMLLLARRALPSLLPVALHSLFTPEEHRSRYRVAHGLLADFRLRLGRTLAGDRVLAPLPAMDEPLASELAALFGRLDRDGDGRLSVAELAAGLRQTPHGDRAAAARRLRSLAEVLQRMDADGDGQLDRQEFAELVLRLRRLLRGRQRLLTYLGPVDADGDEQLDPAEFDRLLTSVGQRPLEPRERQHLFGPSGGSLSWHTLLDRLLLT
jgi:urea transporter